jgi:hypothetical protein
VYRAKFFAHQDIAKRFEPWEIQRVEKMTLEHMTPVSVAQGRPPTAADPRYVLGPDGLRGGLFKLPGDRSNLDGELAGYEMHRLLGIETPAPARVTVQSANGPVEGVIIRYAHGNDFVGALPGEWIEARKEAAESLVARLAMGDYDLKSDNLWKLAEGRVVSIDHGLADPLGQRLPRVRTMAEFEAAVREDMKTNVLGMLHYYASARVIVDKMTIDLMEAKLTRVLNVTESEFREAMKNVFGNDRVKLNDAWRLFEVRRKYLRPVLEQHIPHSLPAGTMNAVGFLRPRDVPPPLVPFLLAA